MDTRRFGRKIKLPATIAIKHQVRKLMFEEAVKQAEAEARADAIRGQPREETRPLVHSGLGAEMAPHHDHLRLRASSARPEGLEMS